MDSSLTDIFCYLMSSRVQDLCGRILSSLERRESKHTSMMAVGVLNRHYVLFYNPDWIAKSHYEDVLATVRHEAYHIVLEHIPRHLEAEALIQGSGDKNEASLFEKASPFASDMAVNSLLIDASGNEYMRSHKEEWVLPGFDSFSKMRPKCSYEKYVRDLMDSMRDDKEKSQERTMTLLLKNAGFGDPNKNSEMFKDSRDQDEEKESKPKEDKEGEGGSGKRNPNEDKEGEGGSGKEESEEEGKDQKGSGEEEKEEGKETLPKGQGFELLSNHRDWSDTDLKEPPESKTNLADELRYQGKAIIKHAVSEHEKSRGTVPSGLKEVIEKLLKEPQVPWTRVFRNIAASAKRTHRRRTISRPRRRHIAVPDLIPFPGKKKDYIYNIAFLIDTSGSMSSRELEMGLNELEGMRKVDKDMTVTVIEADAAVERVYELGSEHDAVKYSVTGRGGTSFDPALLHAQKMVPRPDAVFYFTDGFAPAPHKSSRVPCMFAWIITPNGKVPDEWGIPIKTKVYS